MRILVLILFASLAVGGCDPRGGSDDRRPPPVTPVVDADVPEPDEGLLPVDAGPPGPDAGPPPDRLVVASYNVHNLFDLTDDPQTDEGEYTPGPQWNAADFASRVDELARVFAALDADVVAVLEVETEAALTALRDAIRRGGGPDYGFVAVSPTRDGRGIRLGVLSRVPITQAAGRPINRTYTCEGADGPVTLDGSRSEARPIFQVELELDGQPGSDLVLFINHWKARLDSFPCVDSEHRQRSALQLREVIDQFIAEDPTRPVIALGDFNTFEFEPPIRTALGAVLDEAALERPGDLYNVWGDVGVELFNDNSNRRNNATNSSYNFRGDWTRLDHILLTANMAEGGAASWRHAPDSGGVLHEGFLFNARGYPLVWGDEGSRGFSDHLPIFVTIERR
ncbi:MAG: endonuclease/exonuclease/phosphatase family protein [Myxococcales bacterium]|nr:endonuclease/exonuclease/phosphatase family protein [Myxococcales bacterium]